MSAARLGFLAVLLLVLAIANDWSIPDRLIIIMLVALLVAWIWSRYSLLRLGLRRAIQIDRIRAGDWLIEEFALQNHGLLPRLWIEVQDYSTLAGHRADRVVSLASHGVASWQVSTRCEHRGLFRLGPVVVRSGDPMGLFVRQHSIPAIHDVMVYPAAVDVRDVPIPAANVMGGQPLNLRPVSSAHTVAGIREYATGDPLNRISWAATARLGRMMVKEFDPEPSSDTWIMLDLGFDDESGVGYDGVGDYTARHEYAISTAGSLVERCLDEGRKVGFIINREMPVRFDPDSGSRQWLRIFETLAVVTPYGNRSLAEAIQTDAKRFSRNSGLIVVTSRTSGDWVGAAQSLVRRQVPVSTVLIGSGLSSDVSLLLQQLLTSHVSVIQFQVGQRMVSVSEATSATEA